MSYFVCVRIKKLTPDTDTWTYKLIEVKTRQVSELTGEQLKSLNSSVYIIGLPYDKKLKHRVIDEKLYLHYMSCDVPCLCMMLVRCFWHREYLLICTGSIGDSDIYEILYNGKIKVYHKETKFSGTCESDEYPIEYWSKCVDEIVGKEDSIDYMLETIRKPSLEAIFEQNQ